MSRFDPSVLTADPGRRTQVLSWLEEGLAAVDPAKTTAQALSPRRGDRVVVMAMGKAAAAMSRGAGSVLSIVEGISVSDHLEPTPPAVRPMLGDHPVPGPASLRAGGSVLSLAREAGSSGLDIVALVSGGGSALCEWPRPGIPADLLASVNRRLVEGGAGIAEINLVRGHLSSIKAGGLARAAGRSIDTYVISDVAGADPAVVASGPTVPGRHQPDRVLALLEEYGIDVPEEVGAVIRTDPGPAPPPRLTVVADAQDAALGIAAASGPETTVVPGWLHGPVEEAVDRLLEAAGPGVTVAVGETVVSVSGSGRGGRNTHAALYAATRLQGGGDLFVAFASDGVDGSAEAAGAVVDGSTLTRGGDAGPALLGFDSATYLARTGDLLRCPPTGTNVSDIWIVWRDGTSAIE